MDAVILGVVGLLVGALVTTYGVRLFYPAPPAVGLCRRRGAGRAGLSALLGDGFLATAASWAAGLVLGIAFAVTATLWFWAAVLVLAFSVGSGVGSGILLVASGSTPASCRSPPGSPLAWRWSCSRSPSTRRSCSWPP